VFGCEIPSAQHCVVTVCSKSYTCSDSVWDEVRKCVCMCVCVCVGGCSGLLFVELKFYVLKTWL